MSSPTDGSGVVLDVEALRRVAAALRASAPALAEVTDAAGRALAEVAPVSGVPVLAAALDELVRRWGEGVGPVAGRVDGYGAMLRATVDAHVADDATFAPPPR